MKEFVESFGASILHKYNYSLSTLFAAVYPEFNWEPWRFKINARRIWENDETKKKFVEWAGKKLGIKNLEDWYKVQQTVLFV